jgi:hypothetical protein
LKIKTARTPAIDGDKGTGMVAQKKIALKRFPGDLDGVGEVERNSSAVLAGGMTTVLCQLAKQTALLGSYHFVTLANGGFQLRPIENRNAAPHVADHALLL